MLPQFPVKDSLSLRGVQAISRRADKASVIAALRTLLHAEVPKEHLDFLAYFGYTQYMSTYSLSIVFCQLPLRRFIALAETMTGTVVARDFMGKCSSLFSLLK